MVKAQDIMRQSLETFAKSTKRKQEHEEEVTQRRSKKFGAALYLLKSTHDYEIRTKELELKERELKIQLQQWEEAQKLK